MSIAWAPLIFTQIFSSPSWISWPSMRMVYQYNHPTSYLFPWDWPLICYFPCTHKKTCCQHSPFQSFKEQMCKVTIPAHSNASVLHKMLRVMLPTKDNQLCSNQNPVCFTMTQKQKPDLIMKPDFAVSDEFLPDFLYLSIFWDPVR